MESTWRIARAGRDAAQVHARDVVDGDFDEVMFWASDWDSTWRVVCRLGAPAARVEQWVEKETDWYHYAPYDGPIPAEIIPELDLVNSLPDAHLRDLVRSFQAAKTTEHAAQHQQALLKLGAAQRDADRLTKLVAHSVAKEAALDLAPGLLRETAISLARDWRGDSDDLLTAAEAITHTTKETL